jgi:hypothetical protein
MIEGNNSDSFGKGTKTGRSNQLTLGIRKETDSLVESTDEVRNRLGRVRARYVDITADTALTLGCLPARHTSTERKEKKAKKRMNGAKREGARTTSIGRSWRSVCECRYGRWASLRRETGFSRRMGAFLNFENRRQLDKIFKETHVQ